MSEKEANLHTPMHVRKRNGNLEPIDLNKILRAVARCAEGIADVDPNRVAMKTIGGLHNETTTKKLDKLSIQTAVSLIPENRQYSKLAAAILAEYIRKEVVHQDIQSFSQSIERGHDLGLISDELFAFVQTHARKLDNAVKDENNRHWEYTGLNSVYEHHLLSNPLDGLVIETPQMMFMRIAASEAKSGRDAVQCYKKIANDGPLTPNDTQWFMRGTKDWQAARTAISTAIEAIAYRPLKGGMGQAVAERTILRRKDDGSWENWGDVAERVARGNAALASTATHSSEEEYRILRRHIANANTLMSGRHLQHGDVDQPTRNQEVFSNCATAATSFLLFYLLLNGSGVGRAYDDDMMLVNWDHAPNIRCVLDPAHPDFVWGTHESIRDAKHKYGVPDDMVWFNIAPQNGKKDADTLVWKHQHSTWAAKVEQAGYRVGQSRQHGEKVVWFQVPDSREGWAKALEVWEQLASEKVHSGVTLILDFTPVRPRTLLIGGMQNRPSSGPVALMNAFLMAATMKGSGIAPWKQTIFIDHYFAECVLVGGARRSARMSTKYWRDKTIFDFVTVKRPIEYCGKSVDEIAALRKKLGKALPFAFLWSSNNSIAVDETFWKYVRSNTPETEQTDIERHAKKLFRAVCEAAYGDGTGEPGILNVHKLVQNDEGLKDLTRGDYVESERYKLNDETQVLMARLAKKAMSKKYHMICNPCGEISLSLLGAFCVIADFVPFHCDTIEEATECIRAMVRALIRVNLMDSIYGKEVRRTNRIGIGITGVHEFAWKFFGYGFLDLIDEEKSKAFWLTLARFNRAANEEAIIYSKELGVTPPHTVMTVKPSGSVSKLFGLTEGWHLPAMAYYLRWVQFRSDDPLVVEYRNNGYPVRELREYSGTTIVGFPTAPTITELGMGDKIVTAGEATPEQQFRWLLLGEKYWLIGTDENGAPVPEDKSNQCSYTLKYRPELVDLDHFMGMLLQYQGEVKCCSVMPQEDSSSYEYLPEQPISREEFEVIQAGLERSVWKKSEIAEEVGAEHVQCEGGACPVDFRAGAKS